MRFTGMAPVTIKSEFHKGLEGLIKHNFVQNDMFRVESEKIKYRPGEDKYLFAQKQGILNEVCEVYFYNEFLCDIHSGLKPDEALALINFNLIKKLQKGGGRFR